MRNYLLAAASAAALAASPAMARDNAPYVGIEAGAVIDADTDFDIEYDTVDYDNAFDVDFKPGFDGDIVAGYDFGMIRAEAELGYKKFKADKVDLDNDLADALGIIDDDFDVDGKAKVWSLMGNALLDFGGNGGFGGYVGGGFGRARAKMFGDSDSAWAWQLLAGVYMPVSDNVDVGLKYRYFRTGKLDFNDQFDSGDGFVDLGANGKLTSHSLLASLMFNFGAAAAAAPPPPPPPPPAPPPPPPPATQTCPDGSVILASDACPPPPPPPPPPPMPERG